MIHDKRGELVPFMLNNVQNKIDEEVIEKDIKRTSILKFRQGGCTSFIMAYFLVECMHKFSRAVMLAHDRTHTEKLLRRSQLFLQHLKGPKPSITRMNANEIIFGKTGASFHIGTAGSAQFGRSDTITHLHESEYAFWPNPETLQAGLLQAVPHHTGVVIQETTGNGWGTPHQRFFYKSLGGATTFLPLFFPWYEFEEYQSTSALRVSDLDELELTLMNKFNLTLKQLKWRREKIEEFNGDITIFNQEYPSTVEDAFRLSGGALFNPILSDSNEYENVGSFSRLKPHPIKGYNYILGADVAGGGGLDYSSIVGVCAETLEQVFRYRKNDIDPVQFASVIAEKAKWFNEAYVIVESNQHGISTLSVLKELYPKNKIYKQPQPMHTVSQMKQTIPALHYGWKTTSITKPYMVGIAQQFLLEGMRIYDPILFDELKSFSETAEGRLIGLGEHDDTAIAFMLSCIGLMRVRRFQALYNPEMEKSEAEVKNKSLGWRDEKGRYLMKFEDIVKPKVERVVWTNANT